MTDKELEERCEKCAHFHRLKHNFKKGIGFEESNCCDVLLHLPDSRDDTKPWVQEVPQFGMCEMFTEVKQAETTVTTKNDLGVDCISRDEVCRYVAEFVNHEFSTREEEELIDNIITGIEHLPSVTPQELIHGKCNQCKYYEGVHNVQGHAPCSYHKIGGVMWNWYCSQFENEVKE